MKCLPDRMLQAYIDGEIPESDLIGFDRHLKACPICQERLTQLRSEGKLVKDKLSRLAPARIPAAPPLPAGISEKPPRKSPFWKRILDSRLPVPVAAIAMAGLFVIGVTVGTALRGPSNGQEDRRPVRRPEFAKVSVKGAGSLQVLPVILDLEGYTPLERTEIFTIKE